MDAEASLLARCGAELDLAPPGCCGLAGAFGYEASHYQASMAMGELAVLPAVRAAGQEAVVMAEGFSCATQVSHATGRRPLHLAELLAAGLRDG